MKTQKYLGLLLELLVTAILMAACGGAGPAVPTPSSAPTSTRATVAPSAVPAQPTAASTTPTPQPSTQTPVTPEATSTSSAPVSGATGPAAAGYNGQWEGKSSTDSPIEFTVENNQLTSVTINYAYNSGGCSVGAGYGFTPKDAPIKGNDFAVQTTDSEGVEYSLAGSFASGTDAAGILEVKGKTFCGDTDAKATWTANNTSSASTSGDNVTPTGVVGEATPTAEIGDSDPSTVFGLFFLALDTGHVDDAIAVVSDNVVFQIGSTSGIGKDELKAYMQGQLDKGVVYVGSNVKTTDKIINFSVQAAQSSGTVLATYSNSMVVVDAGKISVLTLK